MLIICKRKSNVSQTQAWIVLYFSFWTFLSRRIVFFHPISKRLITYAFAAIGFCYGAQKYNDLLLYKNVLTSSWRRAHTQCLTFAQEYDILWLYTNTITWKNMQIINYKWSFAVLGKTCSGRHERPSISIHSTWVTWPLYQVSDEHS